MLSEAVLEEEMFCDGPIKDMCIFIIKILSYQHIPTQEEKTVSVVEFSFPAV